MVSSPSGLGRRRWGIRSRRETLALCDGQRASEATDDAGAQPRHSADAQSTVRHDRAPEVSQDAGSAGSGDDSARQDASCTSRRALSQAAVEGSRPVVSLPPRDAAPDGSPAQGVGGRLTAPTDFGTGTQPDGRDSPRWPEPRTTRARLQRPLPAPRTLTPSPRLAARVDEDAPSRQTEGVAEKKGPELEPQHWRYIADRLLGMTNKECAERQGVDPATAWRWSRIEAVADELARLQGDAVESAWRVLKDSCSKAARGLAELCESDDEAVRLRACVEVLNRNTPPAETLVPKPVANTGDPWGGDADVAPSTGESTN